MVKAKELIYNDNKKKLWVELTLLYILLPGTIALDILPVPLMVILFIMGVSVFLFLRYDRNYDPSLYINWQKGRKYIPQVLLFFLGAAAIMSLLTWLIMPERMFYLARHDPIMLLMISIFYPIFSVIPQGLAYRSLLFHRYGKLFSNRYQLILVSALLFSYGHILYRNWLVLLLTFVAGLVFAYRYYQTKSLMVSIIEHGLYGVWLFASGLGFYFVSSFVE